jgi:hypothetical protein
LPICQAINGYPNNYWGWGGEDDEMMRRCVTVWGKNFKMDAPTSGSLQVCYFVSILAHQYYSSTRNSKFSTIATSQKGTAHINAMLELKC